MTFWDDWQLWLKLVFVLSILITVTVIAGIIKLIFDQYKLRKFTRIEKERVESQPMVEEFVRERRGRQAAPFGIRAIESGIEVEGVWISRGNSPASSTPGSPMLSPQVKGKAVAKTSEIPTLQIPEQSIAYSDRSRSPNGSVGSFERATSAERVESVSGTSEYAPVPRSTYKPRLPSALRYSTADDLQANADAVPPRSGSGSSEHSSEASNNASQQVQGYQQVQQPTFYQPTGMTSYNSSPTVPQLARTSPEFGGPSRSNRSSYASQGYAPGRPGRNPAPAPPPPQRFYQPSSSPTQIRDPFASPQAPYRSSQPPPVLEAIELTDNPTMNNIPGDKGKRITRKLQKKN